MSYLKFQLHIEQKYIWTTLWLDLAHKLKKSYSSSVFNKTLTELTAKIKRVSNNTDGSVALAST